MRFFLRFSCLGLLSPNHTGEAPGIGDNRFHHTIKEPIKPQSASRERKISANPSIAKPKWKGVRENKIMETRTRAKHKHARPRLTPTITPKTQDHNEYCQRIMATSGPVRIELPPLEPACS
mgnify:CR=1 FL=1